MSMFEGRIRAGGADIDWQGMQIPRFQKTASLDLG